eukprot:SAG25_NODE_7931_length_449_cov_2.177143_1_plen_67_part_10
MSTYGGSSRDASLGVSLSYLRSFLHGEAQEAQRRLGKWTPAEAFADAEGQPAIPFFEAGSGWSVAAR